MTSPKRKTSKEATHSFSEGGILFKSRVRELGGGASLKPNAIGKGSSKGDSGSSKAGPSEDSLSVAPLQKGAVVGGASLVLRAIMKEKGLGEWALIAGSAAAVVGLALRRKLRGGRAFEGEPDRKCLDRENLALLQQRREAVQAPHQLKGERVQILMIEPGTPDCGEVHDVHGTPRSSHGMLSLGVPSPLPSPLFQAGNSDEPQAVRKMVHKLRQQLRNRDELILEMQLGDQERELEEERVRVVDLEAKLGMAGQTRLELELENQRLSKAASMRVSAVQNGSTSAQADQYELMSLSDEAHRLRQLVKEKERALLEKGRTEAALKKREQEIEGAMRAMEEQLVAKDRLIIGYEQERLQLNSALADLTAQAAQAASVNSTGKSLRMEGNFMDSRDESEFTEPPVRAPFVGPDWLTHSTATHSPARAAAPLPALRATENEANESPDDRGHWNHDARVESRPPPLLHSAVGSCEGHDDGLQSLDDLENGSIVSASRDTVFGTLTPRERLEGRFTDDGEEDTWHASKVPGSVLHEEIEYLKSDLKSRYELVAEKRREENRLLSALKTGDMTLQDIRNSMAVHPEDDSDLEHAWEQFAEGMSLMQYNGTPIDAATQGQMHFLQTRLEQVAIEQCVNQEMQEISRREARIHELRNRIASASRTPTPTLGERPNGSGQGSSNAASPSLGQQGSSSNAASPSITAQCSSNIVSPSLGPLNSVGTPGGQSSGGEATPRRHDSLGQELSQKLAEMEEQKHKSSRDLRQLALSLQQSSPLVTEGRKDVLGKPRSEGVPRPLPRQPLYNGTAANTADASQSYVTGKGDAEGQENRGPQSSSKQQMPPAPATRHQRKRSWPGLNGKSDATENGNGEEQWEMDDELVRLTAEFELEAADDLTTVMIGSPTSCSANGPNPFQQQISGPDSGERKEGSLQLTGDKNSDKGPEYRTSPPLDESPEERAPRKWEPSVAAISNGNPAWHTPPKDAMASPAQSWAVMSPSPSPLKMAWGGSQGRALGDTVGQGRDISPSVVCMGSPVLKQSEALRMDGSSARNGHAGLDAVPEENGTPLRRRRLTEENSRYSTSTPSRRMKRREGGTWDSDGDIVLDEMLNGALDDMVRACSTPGSSANPSPAQSMEFRNSRDP